MGWESFGVVGFDRGPLLQGQARIAKLKSAYNLLIIGSSLYISDLYTQWFDISGLDTPQFDISHLDTPQFDISHLDTPQFDISHLDTPQFDISYFCIM